LKLIPAIILAAALLIAALMIVFVPALMNGAGVSVGTGSVDSAARIDLELLRGEVESVKAANLALSDQVNTMASQIASLQAGPQAPVIDGQTARAAPLGPNTLLNSYDQVVLVADRRNLNQGLTVPTPSFLIDTLGKPREVLSDNCDPMENERLKALLTTRQVGPIEVTMLEPALESLERIFETIQGVDPDLYARINTAGALCVRRIRGSASSVSTHSFGLAVDINIDGVLDTLGDGRTQLGLTILSDFFNAEGWVWGAAYSREDSMHFEVSREKVEEWVAAGKL
jgi:D-alanyl-D-alanine carboxypeptidase